MSSVILRPRQLTILWEKFSSQETDVQEELLEKLTSLQKSLEALSNDFLIEDDYEQQNPFYSWIAHRCLPSDNFADALEAAYSASSEKKRPLTQDECTWQSIYSAGITCLRLLNPIYPIQRAKNFKDILNLLASFTSEADPWTTTQTCEQAAQLLESSMQPQSTRSSCSIVGDLLREKIRPIFAKTKTPAITAAGRRNFHPIPQSRFDSSFLERETKPWKFQDVYATTVLEWVVSQLNPLNYPQMEEYLPLFIPPILSLIDDDSLAFKSRGCHLLSRFLIPLKEVRSDFLKRTNLFSVFEDALIPCLLSLPTITPEADSLQILQAAYPALLITGEVGCIRGPHPEKWKEGYAPTSLKAEAQRKDESTFIQKITAIVRNNIISSFHHISSTTPVIAMSSVTPSTISSFPYPRLSAYILENLSIYICKLGIHTSKYLQDIIPVIYITLTNPFGTAYPPLLEAAMSVARVTILNSYPRIWRFRGELLCALCTCWLNIREEDTEKSALLTFVHLQEQLQEVAYLLRESIDEIVRSVNSREGETGSGDSALINWVGLEENINIRKECEDLVIVDENLKDLLLWNPN